MNEAVTPPPGRTAPRFEEVEFDSHGATCRGDLYVPDGVAGGSPAIVMGHGFGATRACGIAPFAEAFVAAGYVVLVIDYRGFGTSDGAPRRVVDPGRQVEDVLAAAEFARRRPEVRADRVALWGTSFGGGVATVAAARDGRVSAVVAQCPMMDGWAATVQATRNATIAATIRLTGLAIVDVARRLTNRAPRRVPSAGPPGSVAAMTAPDCADGYRALVPAGVDTDVAARFVFTVPRFRPVASAASVACPALVQVCETDTVAPVTAALRAAALMPNCQVRRYPCGHFDIYQGEFRSRSIADQLDFLDAHLR